MDLGFRVKGFRVLGISCVGFRDSGFGVLGIKVSMG